MDKSKILTIGTFNKKPIVFIKAKCITTIEEINEYLIELQKAKAYLTNKQQNHDNN